MTTTNQNNKPIQTIRDGALKASLWKNRKKDDSGDFYSITLTRTYKGSDEQFHDTNSFSPTELLRILKLGDVLYQELLFLKGEHPEGDADA